MIFGNVFSRFSGVAKASPSRRVNYVEMITEADYFTPPHASTAALLKLYRTSPWVRSIVGKVSSSVAEHPFYLETEAGDRTDKHPALDFLRAGSPRLRGRQAIKATQTHLDLAGEAYWVVARDAKGVPVQWAPVPPHWVADLPEGVDGFYTIDPQNSKQQIRVSARDVIEFRDVDPFQPYERGASLTRAAHVELQTDLAASQFLFSFFSNRARPDLIVSGSKDAPLNEVSRGKLEAIWQERHGSAGAVADFAREGVRAAGRWWRPLFSAAPLEVKEIGKGLNDNSVPQMRDQIKATLTEIYGVPPEIFGRLDNSNRATIDAADTLYGKHTLSPRLSFLAGIIEPWLADNFDISNALLKFENPVPEDREFKLKAMQAFRTDFSRNERRVTAGFRKTDDPEDDNLPEEPDPGEPLADPGKPDKPEEKKEIKPSVEKTLSTDEIVRVSEAHENPQVRAEISRVLDAIVSQLINKYGTELLAVLESETRFQLNARVANFVADKLPRLIEGVDDTTRKELQDALLKGAASNEKLDALIARIEKVFEDAAKIRAPLIGQTEATSVTGFASQVAAEQGGFGNKMWVTSQDQVVRASHKGMHKQVRATVEPFRSPSGATAMHPGAFGRAAEDINCRCAMRPVVPGEEIKAAAEFEGMHERLWREISDTIESKWADFFAAQAVVAASELRRVMAGRI